MSKINYCKTRGIKEVLKNSLVSPMIKEEDYKELCVWTTRELQKKSVEAVGTSWNAAQVRITGADILGNLDSQVENKVNAAKRYYQNQQMNSSVAGIDILYDILPLCTMVEKAEEPAAKRFIQIGSELISIKPENIWFNMGKFLEFIGELLLFQADFSQENAITMIVQVVLMVYHVFCSVTIEFDKDDANILYTLYQNSKKGVGIEEEKLIDILKKDSHLTEDELKNKISNLYKYHCIDINDAIVYTLEKI